MRHVVIAGISLALLAVLCASPSLLGDRVRNALDGLDAARPAWLWAAALSFAIAAACGAFAWRAAIRACGTSLPAGGAAARYCVGSGINAVAPAHLGSAVRLALFGRVTRGGCWTVGGAAAAVGVARVVWLGVMIALGSAGGVLPAWPLLAIGVVVAAAGVAAVASSRVRLPAKAEQLLSAFQALSRSPRDFAMVAGWTLAGAGAKVGAAAAVVTALGVDRPLSAALLIVPAVALAAVMPVTPGNVGIASAAVAFVLAADGVPHTLALSAGIAFGGIEWLTTVGVGLGGVLALAGPLVRPYLRFAAAATAYGGVAWAFGLTVVLPAV